MRLKNYFTFEKKKDLKTTLLEDKKKGLKNYLYLKRKRLKNYFTWRKKKDLKKPLHEEKKET